MSRSALLFVLALGLVSQVVSATPNVLLIYTDDQGYGDASFLNPDAKFKTPNLDRLAREGISFTDAHCSDTVCTPSRYGLLTGRYSWRTILKRGVFGAEHECLISDDRMTLATLFKQHGYETAMVGKWHLGMDFPGEKGSRDWTQPVRDMPLDKGFDYFFGIPASMNYGVLAWFEGRYATQPPTLYTAKKPNRMAISDYRIKPPYQQTPKETKAKLGTIGMETAPDFVDSECLTRFTDQAIAWLKQRSPQSAQSGSDKSETPFFLYLPYTSPHKPVIPLRQFRGQGDAGAYGEFMIETDHHVGRVLQFLDESKLADDTLIVFTSDNGPENTWRQRLAKFKHDSRGGLREGKRSIYEGGHRVPFIVRWPNGITQPGRSCDATICQTDLLATFVEMLSADLGEEAGEDSFSFFSVFHDSGAVLESRPIMHHAVNGRLAIRMGQWKLVLPYGKQSAELYNIDADRAERTNVIEKHPTIAATLEQKATDIVCRGRSTPGVSQANDTGYWKDVAWLSEQQYQEQTRAAVRVD